MKLILVVIVVGFSLVSHAFPGDPGSGNSILCIHHEDNKPPHNYALVIAPQSCPAYVGSTTSDSGNPVQETHQVGSGPIFSPTNVATSHHCWVEEKDMGN